MKKITTLVLILWGISFANAQYAVLHNFNDTNGANPYGALIASGNNLYGTTWMGGKSKSGVVFSVQANGTGYTVLHNFIGTDGSSPNGALTLSDSTLYGTTSVGGINDSGVIFSVQTNGSGYTVLHNFKQSDGAEPSNGTLTLSGSTLYGMTYTGGMHGYGTIYSIHTNGAGYTVLHNFIGTDGQQSNCSLTLSGSTLYGMTSWGGKDGYGVVFSINTNGSGYIVLHNFNDSTGGNPVGYLTLSGNTLYGVTNHGGANFLGTIFSIQTNGNGYTDMYNFSGSGTDGEEPVGGLVLSGNTLYGIASQGLGQSSYGLIFSIQTNGSSFSDLFDNFGFDIVYTGMWPENALTLSGNSLYGMTSNGGLYSNYGVIFSLSIPASVNELSTGREMISAFPNPSNGVFNLQIANGQQLMANSQVEVYNMLGEKVYAAPLNPPVRGTSSTTISLPYGEGRGAAGIYLYRVTSETGNVIGTGKIIIQK